MGRLREIPRTASFAWSYDIENPSVVTGTRAGALDANFSNESKLELWDLNLSRDDQQQDLQAVSSVTTDSRFFDIAWSKPTSAHSEGVIAAALEDGSLVLWDAAKLRTDAQNAQISQSTKHGGVIKALQFNPHRPELLATCGAKGELYITDISNDANSYRLGASVARADDFDALDWNKKVAHILATGSNGGYVTVWDVKAKKESLTLNNNGRKPVSAVAWNPDVPTKLATAIPNDSDPLVLLWDLRNSTAPESVLRSHDLGVLSLSWCSQDSGLLLSSGKDNRTICWDVATGQAFGEFPIVSNWTFSTKWSPQHPSILATASLDGKIVIQTIQNTNSKTEESASTSNLNVDGEDFFAKAQSQPQGVTFSLGRPPKWLQRPVAASFGFGGKLITLRQSTTQTRKSEVKIVPFSTDPEIASSIEEFENALQEADLKSLCSSRAEATSEDGKTDDWNIMQTLLSESQRNSLLSYLGFDEAKPAMSDSNGASETKKVAASESSDKANGVADDGASFFDGDIKDDSFLEELSASKDVKNNNPFEVFSGSESETDKKITKALLLGKFEAALDICLEEKRMADAFMIAVCGGQKCIDKAQAAYFKNLASESSYARLLQSVVGKNLWDVVHNANLKNWSEVMAALCTYADIAEFGDLCEALGDRLAQDSSSRKNALFCYLAGSKLDKVVPIWLDEMQGSEQKDDKSESEESEYLAHVKSLQKFIEKVSIFRRIIKFEDKDIQSSQDWKLEPLYKKYLEYADVVAANGHLSLASQYLSLLPSQYPTAETARNRVKQASVKTAAAAQSIQRKQAAVPAPLGVPSSYTPALPPVMNVPTAPSGQNFTDPRYAPPAASLGSTGGYQSAYQPSRPQSSNYAPPNAFSANSYQPPVQSFTPPPPPGPPGTSTSSSGPPPPRASGDANWNDLPSNFTALPGNSRRGTPGPAPPTVTSPFVNSYATPAAPPPPPSFAATRQAAPLPPPPKVGQSPLGLASPPITQPPNNIDLPQRPPSAAASSYAPPMPTPPTNSYTPAAMPSRGSTPYNQPPASAPPPSRYAPAPSAQYTPSAPNYGAPPANVASRPIAPQPGVYGPPPTSSAPVNNAYTAIAPPPTGPPRPQAPPSAPPMSRPPASGPPPPPLVPPPSGPPRDTATAIRPPSADAQRSVTPTIGRAGGDRSQLSPAARTIFETLEPEMQRVKSRAPPNFMPQVLDTEKRLNLLYDALNSLDANVVGELNNLSGAIRVRDFARVDAAFASITVQVDAKEKWLVGIKRLITMSKATPPS